jgi:subtilisin family serine protease
MGNGHFHAGHVIVALDDTYERVRLDTNDYRRAEVIFRAKSKGRMGDIVKLHLRKSGEQAVFDAIENCMRHPNVVVAEPDTLHDRSTIPSDPLYKYLWGMDKIHMPAAWDYATGTADAVVGVMDSGVDYTHPDIMDNLWTSADGLRGRNFCDGNDNDIMDATGHGTHVAGTIGAVGNNHIGLPGVNWRVRIAALKIGDHSFGLAEAIAAVDFAIENGIPILNGSWGGRYFSHCLEHALGQYDGLLIAAAGNAGTDNDLYPIYPASYELDNILSVAATDEYDELAPFSNYGARNVHLAAPGANILSLTLHGGYDYQMGTSMAAAHVAGAAALLKSYRPDLTALNIKEIILSNVEKHPLLVGKVSSGGILNVGAMLESININHYTAPAFFNSLSAFPEYSFSKTASGRPRP